MAISERIKVLSETAGSQTKLAAKTGVHNAVISRIVNANTSTIRSDTLEALVLAFPNLNARWLLTGKGKMWLDKTEVALLHEPDYKERYETTRDQLQKQIHTLDRLVELQDKRVADLERIICKETPDLAREMGLLT
ncbi:MAG: hypothetical protein DHS20C18_04560 [Saprospiraceae bacterium]|nr:MAG: hypothetical protein DHS20C18_04560 [Saprospiraceae bacterium]